MQLTIKDVLNAWIIWGRAGMAPPPCEDSEELRSHIQRMYNYVYKADREIFLRAAEMLTKSSNKDWPTRERLERALIVQRILSQGA